MFAVSGLGIQGNEKSVVALEAKGEVYHEQKLEDFGGTYHSTVGVLSAERDMSTVIIEDQYGVVVVVTVTIDQAKRNVRLVPSASSVTVTLEC